jgi:hypothetical protein
LCSVDQQRIAQLRQHRLLSHPSALPSADDVHLKHIASQQVTAQEKRELLLQQNRARQAALTGMGLGAAAAPPSAPRSQEMLHLSDDLLVKIVDVKLPGAAKAASSASASASAAAPAPSRSKTTFEPAPLTKDKQRKPDAQRPAADASPASTASSASAAASSSPALDRESAAREFTRAMHVIKQMPQVGTAQMDAYKGLMEDFLSTLPPKPAPGTAASSQHMPRVTKDRIDLPASVASLGPNASRGGQGATAAAAAEEVFDPVAPRPQSPFQNQLKPNVPLRRRKKPQQAAGAGAPVLMQQESVEEEDAGSSAAGVGGSVAPSVAASGAFVAGGRPYDPASLVTATGMSMHAAASTGATDAAIGVHAQSPADSPTDEDGDWVYDVYHLPDEPPQDASTAQQQLHQPELGAAATAAKESEKPQPSALSGPTVTPIGYTPPQSSMQAEVDEYKSQYAGVSSAYVTVRDGLLEWLGDDNLVNEDELDAEDTGEGGGGGEEAEEDDSAPESDYPDEEDSSAEEEHQETRRWAPDINDPDNMPYYNARGGPDLPLHSYDAHQHKHQLSLQQLRARAAHEPRAHGFYPEDGPADEEDDDHVVAEVRRAMRASRPELSSDEDGDDEDGPRHAHREQDDDDYDDAVLDEEDMELERGGEDEEEEDDD